MDIWPDPRRRVLKEGDTMYFIREPGRYLEDGMIPQSHPVKGLNEMDSLKCLQDTHLFERRLEELGGLKAGEDGTNGYEHEEAIMAHVKRARMVEAESTESDVPPGEQTMQTGSETMHWYCDKDFLSFFGLPCNCRVKKNALVTVIKNLRGDLGRRIKKGQIETLKATTTKAKFFDQQQVQTEVILEVAKYLVHAYDHPQSKVKNLQDIIDISGAESCIRKILQWLQVAPIGLDQQTVQEFKHCVSIFADIANTEPETRLYVAKSQHQIACTKVEIQLGSPLLGCYSGDYTTLVAKFTKDGDRSKGALNKVMSNPNLCKNLRLEKNITVLATLTGDNTFKLMPGPYDAFQEGYIFLSCEICKGTVIPDCNCAEWLNSMNVKVSERHPYQFDLDEVVVPGHMDNYCFGPYTWKVGQGAVDLRRFTADSETHEGGVQLVGLTRE